MTTNVETHPDVSDLRAVRLRMQRILVLAERFADPQRRNPLRLDEAQLTGVVGDALRRQYDRSLMPAAQRTAKATREQLLRLRLAEAEARGVGLDQVDEWVPEPAESESDRVEPSRKP